MDEKRLKKEFEPFGEIKKVRVIRDLTGKSRRYAFVEYVHMSDFRNAYRKITKKKIGGSYAYVDCEKGRTDKNWKPRRFGGGEGKSREMPRWLKKELEEIRKKYPELSEEKGEIISDGEDYNSTGINDGIMNKKRRRSESEETIKDDNDSRKNSHRNHYHSRSARKSRSRSRSKKNQKKEYEVGEII